MNWKAFLYKSRGRTTDFYYHWLPENLDELVPNIYEGIDTVHDEIDTRQEALDASYKEFDTLTHCTTFENAAKILENGFEPHSVSDNSVANAHRQLLTLEGNYV